MAAVHAFLCMTCCTLPSWKLFIMAMDSTTAGAFMLHWQQYCQPHIEVLKHTACCASSGRSDIRKHRCWRIHLVYPIILAIFPAANRCGIFQGLRNVPGFMGESKDKKLEGVLADGSSLKHYSKPKHAALTMFVAMCSSNSLSALVSHLYHQHVCADSQQGPCPVLA